MRSKQNKPSPKPAKAATAPAWQTRRRNAWEPQVTAPHRVDLPLRREPAQEMVVPASINGRSFITGTP